MSYNKVSYEERSWIYDMAVKTYGKNAQCVVAMEELSEAQKEICKLLRGKGDLEHLAEEVADATICLEQVRLMFDINGKVCEYMDEKVERLAKRVLEDFHFKGPKEYNL